MSEDPSYGVSGAITSKYPAKSGDLAFCLSHIKATGRLSPPSFPHLFFVCRSYRSDTKKKIVYWWCRLLLSDPKPAEDHHLFPLI